MTLKSPSLNGCALLEVVFWLMTGSFGINGCVGKLFCYWVNWCSIPCRVLRIICCVHIRLYCASWWDCEGHDVNNSKGSALDTRWENTIKPEASRRHLQCWFIQQAGANTSHSTVLFMTSWRHHLQANPKLNQGQWALSESNRLVPKAFYS